MRRVWFMRPTIMPGFMFWSSEALNKIPLVPAKAGIQSRKSKVSRLFWIPAYAGMSGAWLRAHLLHQRVGNLEVSIDILHVVAVIKQLDQLEDLFPSFIVECDGV